MARKSRHERLAGFIERRKLAGTPGHCSSCGAEHDEHATGYKTCHVCRARKAEWKARKRDGKEKTVAPVTAAAIMQRVADLERMIKAQKHCRKMASQRIKAAFARGKRKGEMEERERMFSALQNQEAKPWDSWEDELDIDEKKRQFHRFAAACGG